ncbi:copper resistance CopC family protein [Arthrobacter sp.]|uniref:copper resistance CopC family protein n=1 Tax=Arthrobacter sp. TaxID=1667 RepID=UPI003A909895
MRTVSILDSIRRSLATLAVALCVLTVPVSAASAHDSLSGSSPQDGQTVAKVPASIRLTFSEPPLALGSKMTVVDSAGKDWATGKIEVVDRVASQAVDPEAPSGAYTVTWRVVSADSHPIEGAFAFTATAGNAASRTAAATAAAPVPAAPTASQTTPASGQPAASVSDTEARAFPTGLVVTMILLILVVGGIVVLGMRIRSAQKAG